MSEKIKDLFRYGIIKTDERKENEDGSFRSVKIEYENKTYFVHAHNGNFQIVLEI